MPTAVIPRLRGMFTDAAARPVGGCVLAKNVTWHRGRPRGRRGTKALYSGATLGLDGPVVGLCRYRSRSGADYRIVAGYNTAVGASNTYGFRVNVTSGYNVVTAASFQLPGGASYSFLSPQPVGMAAFGDSVYITGEGVGKFIRCRFQRHAVTVAEAVLVDRTLDPFSAADDPGPWLGRLYSARCIASFQGRLFVAGLRDDPDTLFWSNIGDALGWSAQNSLRIREGGKITAIAEAGPYLLVFKETRVYAVRGGFTSSEDTSVEIVEPRIGALGQRCVVKLPGGGVFCMSREGIAEVSTSGARVLSGNVNSWLRGQLDMTEIADFHGLVPNPQSLAEAPMAYLPSRKELYVALSAMASPQDAASLSWGEIPTVWLVGNLEAYTGENPEDIDWSIWQGNGTPTVQDPIEPPTMAACSMLAGSDVDGNDELLFGTHNGRVRHALRGSTDAYFYNASERTATITASMIVKLADPTVETRRGVDTAERTTVSRVELEWADSTMATDAVSIRYGWGSSDGSQDGTENNIDLASKMGQPYYGTTGIAWGTTLKTLGTRRGATTLRGLSSTQAPHIEISGAPLPALGTLKVASEQSVRGV